jgi:hypothetical protein
MENTNRRPIEIAQAFLFIFNKPVDHYEAQKLYRQDIEKKMGRELKDKYEIKLISDKYMNL